MHRRVRTYFRGGTRSVSVPTKVQQNFKTSNGGGLGLEPGQVIRAVLDIKKNRGTHVRRGKQKHKIS